MGADPTANTPGGQGVSRQGLEGLNNSRLAFPAATAFAQGQVEQRVLHARDRIKPRQHERSVPDQRRRSNHLRLGDADEQGVKEALAVADRRVHGGGKRLPQSHGRRVELIVVRRIQLAHGDRARTDIALPTLAAHVREATNRDVVVEGQTVTALQAVTGRAHVAV